MYGGAASISSGTSNTRSFFIKHNKTLVDYTTELQEEAKKLMIADGTIDARYSHGDINMGEHQKYLLKAGLILAKEEKEQARQANLNKFIITISGSNTTNPIADFYILDIQKIITHINNISNNTIFYISINYRVININTITSKLINLTTIKGIANVLSESAVDYEDKCGIFGGKCPNIKEGLEIFLYLKNKCFDKAVEEIGNITMSNDMLIQKYKKNEIAIEDSPPLYTISSTTPAQEYTPAKRGGYRKKTKKKSKKKLN